MFGFIKKTFIGFIRACAIGSFCEPLASDSEIKIKCYL